MMYDYVDIVGDTFEDMSIEEMASVQGLGDIEGRKSSTPLIKQSSQACVGFSAGLVITIFRCRN